MMLRKMFYLFTAVSLLAFATGCEDKKTDENNAPSITLNTPTEGQAVTGSGFTVAGKVTDDNSIDNITYTISTGTSAAVLTKNPGVAYEGKKEVTLDENVSITTVANGTYDFKVTASDKDGKSTIVKRTIIISGGDVGNTTSGSLSLGAQNSTNGSYLDVDAGVVYKSADLVANVSKVDIVVGFIQADAKIFFMSQSNANGAGFNSNLSTTDKALIKSTTLSLSDYNGVSSSTALKTTFDNAAGAGAERVEIKANTTFAIKTNNSATATYALIYVTSVTASASGDAVLTVKYKKIAF